MSDRIVIAHAYRGFTYLPLFLAHDLGYFPQGVELEYADGDLIAMQSVLHVQNPRNLQSDFAICDPLLVADFEELIGARETGPVYSPIVIGSLIRRTPLWLFNTNHDLRPVGAEEQLRGSITKIRCYSQPNTGYIVGKRLLQKLELPEDAAHFEQVDFDHEFDTPLAGSEVVVTSNILRMGEFGFNNHNIVFSYASKRNEIQDMFFTGVITRDALFKEDLPLVLAILAGLKKAIHRINEDDIDEIAPLAFAAMKKMRAAQNQPSQFVTTDENAQEAIVKRAILDIFRGERLYSPTLEVRKEEWDKSIAFRRPHTPGWVDPPYEAFTDEIPVILIGSDWRDGIIDHIAANRTKMPAAARRPMTLRKWLDHLTVPVGLAGSITATVICLLAIVNGLQLAKPSAVASVKVMAIFISLLLLGVWVAFGIAASEVLGKRLKFYPYCFGAWITLVTAAAGLTSLLKS
jgi:hypothetical protein